MAMPVWLVVTVAVGTPMLTFLAAIAANLVTRRGAQELESRSKREETMRHLKWAAELAVADDQRKSALGIRELQVLSAWNLPDSELQGFVDAAMDTVYADAVEEVEAARRAGEGVIALRDLDLRGSRNTTDDA